jgi:hypothetical protein
MAGMSSIHSLKLSHSPMLEDCLPDSRVLPQFIRNVTNGRHFLHSASPQNIFTWFRQAGPLVSVRNDINVGHGYPTYALEYWNTEHAEFARNNCHMMHPALSNMKAFNLQTYDPCKLICSVSVTSSHNCVHESKLADVFFGPELRTKLGTVTPTRSICEGMTRISFFAIHLTSPV